LFTGSPTRKQIIFKKKPPQIRFKPHTITKMIDINMNSTIAGLMNARN